MSKTACVFPGQGSQYVGMGKDLFDAFPEARRVFEEANEILGFDLAGTCFEGPEEKLKETRFTQPAIVVHSVAVWSVIKASGIQPAFVAGHSVGEYSALVANGALAFADALRLVRDRAEAMFSAGLEKPGTMAALIGISEEGLDGLLKEAGAAGVIAAANYNSPVQVVISGDIAAVEKAMEIARGHGAKRAIPLNVSGAFHSPLMKQAREKLAASLKATAFSDVAMPVVCNVTAEAETAPEAIRSLLERQLTSPVLWHQSMKYLSDNGVDSVVEVGPGKVLCGLLKRISPDTACVSVSDQDSIGRFLEGVSA
ncbi:ACP S-malonyltransferase [Candidatus Eisenbacteria bacterium]|uniref:Malonyl CoA-acyl carrier protein transacylase n=1 Tax=Eiseniibacteriota bacterium TaxID=2212470 RepID=A0ABV6YP63_UNCEI